MTTVITFAPQKNSNFQFQAELDGETYTVVVTWNLFGARYYINVYTPSGSLVVSTPLIGSPLGYNIQSISVNTANIAVVTTATMHGYRVGSVVWLTISGCTPAGYNGTYLCNVMSRTQLSFKTGQNLNPATTLGQIAYNLSLVAGYFESTMVYNPDNQQILISP